MRPARSEDPAKKQIAECDQQSRYDRGGKILDFEVLDEFVRDPEDQDCLLYTSDAADE